MVDIYVSPIGEDTNPGTIEAPFATLERAQLEAQKATSDVTIHLRAGTHTLSQALTASEPVTHHITYQAYRHGKSPEQVTISGGHVITEWQQHNGIWQANIGELDARQLYVDDERVERANIQSLPENTHITETGYTLPGAEVLKWQTPSSVEFVYRGVYPWTEARCGVTSVRHDIDATVITMAQPAFSWAHELYNSAWDGNTSSGPGLPTRIENDPSFLTTPGAFTIDRGEPGQHILRYSPRPGEDPTSTRVVLPAIETLIRLTGVRNMSFKDLTFADATWLLPNQDQAFLHYHGSGYYNGTGEINKVVVVEDQAWVTVPSHSETIPACIQLEQTTNIHFDNCHFTRLGATALGAVDSDNFTVRDCSFHTLAASALTVKGGKNTLIGNNFIDNIGLDYSGSPGIAVSDTIDCELSHNHISHVPHCGIVAGPGQGTKILRNLTANTMNVLADGGGIYLAGPQGDSHTTGAVVSGNVIQDTRTPYNFGLYTDYGASWVTVERNVVIRADSTSILHVSPPLENVIYRNNFWDAEPIGSDNVPAGVIYQDNTTINDEHKLHAAAFDIHAHAGLKRDSR